MYRLIEGIAPRFSARRKGGQIRQLSELGAVSVISEHPGVVCVQVETGL